MGLERGFFYNLDIKGKTNTDSKRNFFNETVIVSTPIAESAAPLIKNGTGQNDYVYILRLSNILGENMNELISVNELIH